MLVEWLTHLNTPCPQPYRRMGYLKELIGIQHRHKRCRVAWAPHLEKCRQTISGAAENCPSNGRAVVLGSGMLLDIPLEKLARTFDEVLLVDICHLKSVRKQASVFANVRFVETDISGVVLPLATWVGGDQNTPLPSPVPDCRLISGADYVVSANLLAQLPITPITLLDREAPGLDQDAVLSFARNIIDHHLSLLQSVDCPVTLITETLRLIGKDGVQPEKVDPLYGAPVNLDGKEWWWDLAPRPEFASDMDIRLVVRAVADLNSAPHARYCRNTTRAAP